MCPRFLRNVCFVKCLIKLIDFYQITTVDTVKRQYCAQYCFLNVFEILKSAVDKGKLFGVLLTNLSKSLIVSCMILCLRSYIRLYYGFSFSVLKSIHSYLTSSKRRTKIYY